MLNNRRVRGAQSLIVVVSLATMMPYLSAGAWNGVERSEVAQQEAQRGFDVIQHWLTTDPLDDVREVAALAMTAEQQNDLRTAYSVYRKRLE